MKSKTLVLFLAIIVCITMPVALHAATFNLDSTADAVDANPGNGVCATVASTCTLRAAIQEANALPGSDTINMPVGTYNLTIAGAGENASATGDLDITDSVTIMGSGAKASQTIINGLASDRVMELDPSVSGGITVTLFALTVRNGAGGILSNATLYLTDVDVRNNIASGYAGGLHNSSFGTATLLNVTIDSNSDIVGNAGGILNSGVMIIDNSTISLNTTSLNGGGLVNNATLTMTNSTIHGNHANANGGGMLVALGSVTTLNNVTIASNIADDDNNGSGDGGGIANFGATSIDTANSILSGNVDNGAQAPDCSGNLNSQDYNLIKSTTGCTITGTTTHNVTGADPLLGVLKNNGGGTFTRSIPLASVAHDAGNSASCAGTDQRGVRRPQGSVCDMGAFEQAPADTFVLTVLTDSVDAAIGDGICADGAGECSLRAAVQESNALAGDNTIILLPGVYNLTIAGASENASATGDLDILNSDLNLVGYSNILTRIHTSVSDRILDIAPVGSTSIQLGIQDIRLTGGSEAFGGAIYNNAILGALRTIFLNNQATLGGGAIANGYSAHLFLDQSTFDTNNALNNGGAIENVGTLYIQDSVFAHNGSTSTVMGGAISQLAGDATIVGSHFSNNTAQNGGAIINSTTALFMGVEFDGNKATVNGGAISNGGSLTFNTGWVTNNAADSDHNNSGAGGGIYSSGGTLSLGLSYISGNSAYDGAGIYANFTTGTLGGLSVTGNSAEDAGGGIFVGPSSSFDLVDTILSTNDAVASGSGIASLGTLTVTSGTISGNKDTGITVGGGLASVTNTSISGNSNGGIMVLAGALNVSGSTIANNLNFGGIQVLAGASALINNTTISGNQAGGGIIVQGGGLFNGGTTTLNNSTVAFNTAASGGGGISNTGTLNISNSIVGKNTDLGATSPDCNGTLSSLGHNLVQNMTGCTITGTTTGNILGFDPHLGPLQNNGGLTMTHALLSNSLAVESGDPATCMATDQTGLARPQGATCDIGAYELPAANFKYIETFALGALNWTYKGKASWNVVGGNLQAVTSKKGDAYGPSFGGCSSCTFDANLEIVTPAGRDSIWAWYKDVSNRVELRIMADKNAVQLMQKAAGVTVAKVKAAYVINPGQLYHVKMLYNGSAFQVFIDGALVLTKTTGTAPNGNAGLRAKSTTGLATTSFLSDIVVY